MEENEQKSSNTGIASWSYCRDLFLDNYYMAAVRPAVYYYNRGDDATSYWKRCLYLGRSAVVIIGTYSNHKTSTLN